MKKIYMLSTALGLAAAVPAMAVEKSTVLYTYANIATAKYADNLTTA